MQCYKYESTKHFASNCPHQNIEKTNLTMHITLVTGTADFGTIYEYVSSVIGQRDLRQCLYENCIM